MTLSSEKINAFANRFSFVKLDTQEQASDAASLKVASLPTLVFLASDGKEIKRLPGFQEADALAKEMEQILAQATKPK